MIEKYLSAFFTRKEGFEIISTNLGVSKQEVMELLLRFIPQGKTPRRSQLLGYWKDYFVASYLETVSDTDFFVLMVFIRKKKEVDFLEEKVFSPGVNEKVVMLGRKQLSFQELRQSWEHYSLGVVPKVLGEEEWAYLLFSLLVGDNIIVFSKDYAVRSDFFELLVHSVPVVNLSYNQFVLEALEIQGNFNVVGVSFVPDEKEVLDEFGLDTIIVDLDGGRVFGEGLKICPLVRELARDMVRDFSVYREIISSVVNKWVSYNWSVDAESNAQDQILLQKIRKKLFGEEEEEDDFFSEF